MNVSYVNAEGSYLSSILEINQNSDLPNIEFLAGESQESVAF
jgi:hypothetical protein